MYCGEKGHQQKDCAKLQAAQTRQARQLAATAVSGLKDNESVENLLAQVRLDFIKACLLLNQYLGASCLTLYTSYTDPAGDHLVFRGRIRGKEMLIMVDSEA